MTNETTIVDKLKNDQQLHLRPFNVKLRAGTVVKNLRIMATDAEDAKQRTLDRYEVLEVTEEVENNDA